MKRVFSFLLIITIFIGRTEVHAVNIDIETAILDTGNYLYATVSNPSINSVGGDWLIFAISRSNFQIPNRYYENYYGNVQNYVIEKKGLLHKTKYTEYARVALALTAIGKNPQNVGGYDLIEPLLNFDKTIKQGLNGPIWALIALDSGNFGSQEIKTKYLNYILDKELSHGGWSLTSKETDADVDITAMALVALSKHREQDGVAAAIERGINILSEKQTSSGGYISYGTETSESTAQVLVAISEIGISTSDERFTKNGKNLLDNLFTYYVNTGGFKHTHSDTMPNQMASEQALYALSAIARFQNREKSLFDLSDIILNFDDENNATDIKKLSIVNHDILFSDVTENITAISELAKHGIINGRGNNLFYPKSTVTRAEFAAITVRSLGLPIKSFGSFSDVDENDWFFKYVNTAYYFGIVNGVSKSRFNPRGTITLEEAAVMTTRAAVLCGANSEYDNSQITNTLSSFSDYIKVSDWAASSIVFCYNNNILDANTVNINPKEEVTRAKIAQMLYNMLNFAGLI